MKPKSKAKSKNFIIRGSVYPFDILVSLGETDQQVLNRLSQFEMPDFNSDRIRVTGLGLYVQFENSVSLIRLYRMVNQEYLRAYFNR